MTPESLGPLPGGYLQAPLPLHQPPEMAPREKWVSQVKPWAACSPERKVELLHCWTVGELEHLLTPGQCEANAAIERWSASPLRRGLIYILDISRRWGKSVLLCKRALEKAIRNPGWRIVYCAPEYKMVNKILVPLMGMLLLSCPPGLHGTEDGQGPKWVSKENAYVFNNGARIELIGLDVNPDGARGQFIDYAFIDEGGFFDKLEYVINSVVMPMMMGRAHARLECASTPPVSPAHFWSSELVKQAKDDNAHDTRTIEDAAQYSSEEIEMFIRLAGGRRHTTCRREYFAEHVTDENMAIIPEFRDVADEIVMAMETLPHWRDCYESMDPGWNDHTAVLFAYVDFEQALLVIEDEISAPRLTSDDIAAAIKLKEEALWGKSMCRGANNRPRPQPYQRWSDRDPEKIDDLRRDHGIVFYPTQKKKDALEADINALRNAIAAKRIRIHPRCKRLIADLKNGVWKNAARKIFAHSSDLSHFDTIAALVYLWRNVDLRRNPAPPEERFVRSNRDETSGYLSQAAQRKSRWHRRGFRYRLT